MRKLLLFVFLVASCAAFAQVPSPSTPWLMNDQGYISKDNPLPVDAEMPPVFADHTGEPATATIDIDNRAVINIGSETIGLIDKLNEVKTATASETKLLSALNPLNPTTNSTFAVLLSPNVAHPVSAITDRLTVTYFNHSPTVTVWVRHDGVAATVGWAIPVPPMGFLSFKVPNSASISVIASEAATVTIYQEGR